MTVRQLEDYLTTALAGLYEAPEAAAIAGQVAGHLLGLDRLGRSRQRDVPVTSDTVEEARLLLARLLRHEPVQYVLQTAHFYGFDLYVNPAVLIPRPETEELVDLIIRNHQKEQGLRVLDIGSGSGCIPISLGAHLPVRKVWGLDVSGEALAVARQNAKKYKVPVEWLQRDIMVEEVPLPAASLDLVVSNPPYVLERERVQMRPNVTEHEPHLALFVPNEDPLLFYRKISQEALRLLLPGGTLYVELNEQYGAQLDTLFQTLGYEEVLVLQDIYGKDRFLKARKPTIL